MMQKSSVQTESMNSYFIDYEMWNTITHGLGVLLSIAGTAILIVFASLKGDAYQIVSFSIYGACLITLYTASTLYHGTKNKRLKAMFNFFDHASIFLLIAGTYTPVMLIGMRGAWGWSIFGAIWGLAIGGIIYKIFLINKYRIISTIIYVGMSWSFIIAIKPALEMVPFNTLLWIFIGGVFYTSGVIFYIKDKKKIFHVIWHLFVLAGSISHYIAMTYLF